MCSQYHLEAMMRKESRSVRCEKQGVEQTSHTLSERDHRESCPLLFRRNGGELPPVLCERSPFFLGDMEEHPRRPFREQNRLRSRESPKRVLSCGKIFSCGIWKEGFSPEVNLRAARAKESPRPRSILPIFSLKESRRVVPRNQGELCPTFMRKEPLLERK